MMDPSTTPAAPPPPGVQANFENPETRNKELGIVVAAVGMAFSTLFLLLRIYTKFAVRLVGPDDVLLILAWVISVGLTSVVIYFWAVEECGVHMWDLYLDQANRAILAPQVCSILYIPLMGLAKVSLLCFYRRLSPQRWFKWSVYAAMALIAAYSIALELALIFACSPLKKNWDITVTEGKCLNKGHIHLSIAGLSAATDLILLILPIPMIIKLRVPRIQKIGLIIMFSIGSATLVTSLIRLRLIHPMLTSPDITWEISPPAVWICIEASLTVVCSCLPTMRLFFLHVAPHIIGEARSYGSGRFGKLKRKHVHDSESLEEERRGRDPWGGTDEWDNWIRKPDPSSATYTMGPTGQIVRTKSIHITHEPQLPSSMAALSLSRSPPTSRSPPINHSLSSPEWFPAKFPSPPSSSRSSTPHFELSSRERG